MTYNGRRVLALIVAGVAWATLAAVSFGFAPQRLALLALGVAVAASTGSMLRCYQRPLGDAYELGYSRGRRDAIREANGRGPSNGGTPVFLDRERSA